MNFAIIALGSNLAGRYASPADAVRAAIDDIDGSEIRVTAQSRLYRSDAWPDPSDPSFANAVIAVETALSPADLLARLHALEAAFGRERGRANAPRTLDLDIVDYGGMISAAGETPILPHPRMGDRAFVLLPLADVAPHWRHPVSGTAIQDMIAALPIAHGATPL